MANATASGRCCANSTIPPGTMLDTAMPCSTNRSGTPMTPGAPAKANATGKATGSIHSAGAPRIAPQRPTATMARIWSNPVIGC